MQKIWRVGVRKELLKTVKAKKLGYILWSHHNETREKEIMKGTMPCTQARKTMHSLDGQHKDVDRTRHGRVNENSRGQR